MNTIVRLAVGNLNRSLSESLFPCCKLPEDLLLRSWIFYIGALQTLVKICFFTFFAQKLEKGRKSKKKKLSLHPNAGQGVNTYLFVF